MKRSTKKKQDEAAAAAVDPNALAAQVGGDGGVDDLPMSDVMPTQGLETIRLNSQRSVPPVEDAMPDGGKRNSKEVMEQRLLDNRLPAVYQVEIWRQDDSGHWGMCDIWNSGSIIKEGSAEAFIRKFVVPKWGYGRFQVYRVNPDNSKTNKGTVYIQKPVTADEDMRRTDALDKLLDFQLEELRGARNQPHPAAAIDDRIQLLRQEIDLKLQGLKPAAPATPTRQDPLDLMREIMAIKAMGSMLEPSVKQPQGPDPALVEVVSVLKGVSERLTRLEMRNMEPNLPAFVPPPAPEPDRITIKDLLEFSRESRNSQSQTPDAMAMLDKALTITRGAIEPQLAAMAGTVQALGNRLELMANKAPAGSDRAMLVELMELMRNFKTLQEELAPPPPPAIIQQPAPDSGGSTLQAVNDIIGNIPNVIHSIRDAATNHVTSAPMLRQPATPVQPQQQVQAPAPSATQPQYSSIDEAIALIPSMSDEQVITAVNDMLEGLSKHAIFGPRIKAAEVPGNPAATLANLVGLLDVALQHFVSTNKLTAENKERILRLVKASGVHQE